MAYDPTRRPVDCDVDFDTNLLIGKSAIVTGGKFQIKMPTWFHGSGYLTCVPGANGLGEAYVRALNRAGSACNSNKESAEH